MTPQAIAGALGISRQAVHKRLRGVKAARLRIRGGHDYDVGQLPQDWQEKIRESARLNHPTGAAVTSPEVACPITAAPPAQRQGGGEPTSISNRPPAVLVPSTSLRTSPSLFSELALPSGLEAQLASIPTPAQQREALDLFHLIEPTLDGHWRKYRGHHLQGGRVVETKRNFMDWYAAQKNTSATALYRQRQRFLEGGLTALVRHERRDKGRSRTLDEADRLALASLYLKEGNARATHREFRRQHRRIGYDVVKRYVRTLPQPVVSRALAGSKEFNDGQLPYWPRDYDKLQPNDVLVFDHTQFDLFVNAWGKAARPWLTAIMDMKSRHIVGWCLSLQPDSLTIASALRMAVLECGVPQAVYLDNGKDFRSHYLSGAGRSIGRIDLPGEARGLFEELGVRIIYATPYHPQAKSIERWFGTLHRQFDAGWNSYCGGNPAKRPETCQPLLDEHKDCVAAGNPEASPLPRIEALAFGLRAWLAEEYDQQVHKGRGMRGRSPAQVYQPSDVRVEDWRLDLLLMKHEQRKVVRGGVTLFDHRYEHEANGLFLHNGHLADVSFDPFGRALPDTTQVVVSCCDDRYLCRHLGEPETYEGLQDRLRGRRKLKQAVEAHIAEIHRRAAIQSPGERRQVAAAQAALPAGVDPRATTRALKPAVVDDDPTEIEAGDVALPDYGAKADEMMGGDD
jgi:transposase InsO family protein